jgi:DNA-binding transcriptional MerR regulator
VKLLPNTFVLYYTSEQFLARNQKLKTLTEQEMNCKEVIELLNPYIDKTLDADMAKQVDDHLKSCSACRKEYLELNDIISAVNSLSPQPAPENLTENIMAKILQKEIQIQTSWMDRIRKQISIPRLSFRLVSVAAVAVVAVFFAFTFIFNTPDTYPICSAEVQFSLKISDGKAHTVAIAGDFNGWNPQANILEDPEGDGIWTGTLKLEPGRYEYMFVLDGEKWFPDPNALRYVKDGFGNRNAILEINNCNST